MDAMQLQELLDKAPNHSRVRIPQGEHVVGQTLVIRDKSLRVNANQAVIISTAPIVISLQNAGGSSIRYGTFLGIDKPGNHYIPPSVGDYHPIFSVLDSDDVVIRDTTIRNRTHGLSTLRSHRLLIRNLNYAGVVSAQTAQANWYPAIHTTSDYTTVRQCQIYNTGSGVLVGSPARYTRVESTLVDGFRDNALYLSTSLGASIVDCKLRRGWEGSSSAIKNHGSLWNCLNNEIEGCNIGIACLGSNSHGYEYATEQMISGNDVVGCRSHGIYVAHHGQANAGYHAVTNHVTIEENQVLHCGTNATAGIYVIAGTDRPVDTVHITRNMVYRNRDLVKARSFGIQVMGNQGNAVTNVLVQENLIHGPHAEHSIGLRMKGVQGYAVDKNRYYNCVRNEWIEDSTP
jgi:hypothetical protein